MWTDFLEHHCQLTVTHVIHSVISYDVSHHIAYHQNNNDYVSKVITKKKIVLGLRKFFLSQMLIKEMTSFGIHRSYCLLSAPARIARYE